MQLRNRLISLDILRGFDLFCLLFSINIVVFVLLSYYTGLTDKARIRVEDGKVKTYRLNRDYTVEITVRIPANGHTWLVVE